ncbi:hypothetical protein TWF730_009876 [Orbilia blumenaviensis]|uniref:Fe2OG dioxygenase domain-containing protein n=1 Tax=Orbilia blumenaviensis TaxID=1796055 RepID=A0AAV9UTW9_9PEZI
MASPIAAQAFRQRLAPNLIKTSKTTLTSAKSHANPELLHGAIALLNPTVQPPFKAIRHLFDHLRANPTAASALNNAYPKRGIFKSAAIKNGIADQKFTIDLSPARDSLISEATRASLASYGLNDVISFFNNTAENHVSTILSQLGKVSSIDLSQVHKDLNMNFRLCDYNPLTANPTSSNGCGEHTDYGTFSIIFQDGTPGLEIEAPHAPGTWIEIPGDATVVLAGWCAFILTGGRVCAVRHRVRRIPGVRRLSAVLFVAPDLEVKLKPLTEFTNVEFSKEIIGGEVNVSWFKDVMGKRWRRREGNLEVAERDEGIFSQDDEIRRLVLGA